MTPDEKALYKGADATFERTKKASDIYFDTAAKADPASTLDRTIGGFVTGEVLRPLKSKGTHLLYSAAKTGAQKAMNRL
jgi:hypothetical protein